MNEVAIAEFQEKFPHPFSVIGLLQKYELKLHIDEAVKPIVQPVRCIPFNLRDKVDEKRNELLKEDSIEEMPNTATTWVLPLVVVPKRNGEVRGFVDMRRANPVVQRERFLTPSVEEYTN